MEEEIKTEKIFVDQDEDIVFTVEKISESECNRIILIVPRHSLLTSSLINLKLLSRQLAESNKFLIFVTENELALNKGIDCSLTVVSKVNDINENVWENSIQLTKTLQEERKEIKEKLIAERKEDTSIVNIPEESEPIDEQVEKVEKIEEVEEIEPIIKKHDTRLKAKLLNIKGFEILSGGDIKKLNGDEDEKKEVVSETNEASKSGSEFLVSSSFIGRDMRTAKSNFRNRRQDGEKPSINLKDKINTKLISAGIKSLIILVIPLLLFGYILKSFTKVTINITPKAEDINISENVTASKNVQDIELSTKTIPLRNITTQPRSVSNTGDATGEKETGEKAKGVVDFSNKSNKEIVLDRGTKITTLTGNLTFILDESIKIPARASEITPTRYENAPITAETFGEEYNVSAVDVKVAGYDTISQLSGRIYREVKGGTSKKVKVVSQADIDNLKTNLTNSLKDMLNNDVKNLLSDNDIEIPNTSNFKELAFEVTPPVGTETESFDITKLEYELTISIVNQKDLDKFVDEYISSQFGESSKQLNSNKSASINKVEVLENGDVKFELTKEGKAMAEIKSEDIIASIINKSYSEAESILKSNPSIEKFEIKYSPFFIPSFLREIPQDKNRITISIEI